MCEPRADIHVVEETELLGSAGTILRNRDWIDSEEPFWVFYADVLCRFDFAGMLRLHQSRRPAATIGVYEVPDPSRCGVVEASQDGTVIDFVEKPSCPRSNFAFSGILLGTRSLLDAIPRKQPVDLGFDVLPKLTGKMVAYPISSYVLDIGTKENYELAQSTWPGLDN
jgi:mannose-1-phosphate guanylyltransferase